MSWLCVRHARKGWKSCQCSDAEWIGEDEDFDADELGLDPEEDYD